MCVFVCCKSNPQFQTTTGLDKTIRFWEIHNQVYVYKMCYFSMNKHFEISQFINVVDYDRMVSWIKNNSSIQNRPQIFTGLIMYGFFDHLVFDDNLIFSLSIGFSSRMCLSVIRSKLTKYDWKITWLSQIQCTTSSLGHFKCSKSKLFFIYNITSFI
jgi:hypothetical protein